MQLNQRRRAYRRWWWWCCRGGNDDRRSSSCGGGGGEGGDRIQYVSDTVNVTVAAHKRIVCFTDDVGLGRANGGECADHRRWRSGGKCGNG